MADTTTGLERATLVVGGDRAELRVENGRVTLSKQTLTQAAPTSVVVEVDRIRGTQLETPSRGSRGWFHLRVVGGSPAPPDELTAAGDVYTLPLTTRSVGAARRFAKLVDRHVRERGMPSDTAATPDRGSAGGRLSTSVAFAAGPASNGAAPSPSGRGPAPSAAPPAPAPSAAPPSAAQPAPPPPGDERVTGADLVAELRALADLQASGALTDAEFERAKTRVLGDG